jgi:hypothetical protein
MNPGMSIIRRVPDRDASLADAHVAEEHDFVVKDGLARVVVARRFQRHARKLPLSSLRIRVHFKMLSSKLFIKLLIHFLTQL